MATMQGRKDWAIMDADALRLARAASYITVFLSSDRPLLTDQGASSNSSWRSRGGGDWRCSRRQTDAVEVGTHRARIGERSHSFHVPLNKWGTPSRRIEPPSQVFGP